MSFSRYRGLKKLPLAIHAVPHYTDNALVMRVHTNCPFNVDDLPEVGSPVPPPLAEGQQAVHVHRDDWGRPLTTLRLTAVMSTIGLTWKLVARQEHPQARWGKQVLFPG